MSDDKEYTDVENIIRNSIEENPSAVADSFKSVIGVKTMEFINNKRDEISSNYFTNTESEE